jgi:hypothetical protein
MTTTLSSWRSTVRCAADVAVPGSKMSLGAVDTYLGAFCSSGGLMCRNEYSSETS